MEKIIEYLHEYVEYLPPREVIYEMFITAMIIAHLIFHLVEREGSGTKDEIRACPSCTVSFLVVHKRLSLTLLVIWKTTLNTGI